MNTAKTKPVDSDEIETASQLPALAESGGMVTLLTKAELDTQIATARMYPRSITKASDDIMSLATLDEQTAAENIFSLPRGGKPIRGASIRLAEIIGQAWGNCRVDSRVVNIDRVNKVIEAEGTFHDLETNSATRSRVQRRISDKRGRIFNDDMIVVTGNAACAIAKRNAILAGVPKAVWRKAYEASERVVAGDIKTLATRREAAVRAFATYGVKPEQIFAALEVEGIEDISLEHIPTLQGMFSALKNGEATVEEMFDPRRIGGQAFEVVQNPLKDEPESAPPETDTATAASPPHTGVADDQAAGATESSIAQEEQSVRGPDVQPLPDRVAYERGRQARAAGHSRKSIPGEYRTSEALCWLAGFDGSEMPNA